MYDITDKDTFMNVQSWMKEIEKYAQENVNILLIGNKNDLEEQRMVQKKEGEDLAASYNIPFMETSASNSVNIKEAFTEMAKNIMQRVEKEPNKSMNTPKGMKLGQATKISIKGNKKQQQCC